MKTYDFLVVGSGIAGLSFALRAAAHGSVAILTKRGAEASNTAWAQGGIATVMGADDSMDLHVADTLDAGAGLCHEDVVRTIVSEGPECIEELIARGVQFDSHKENGVTEIDLGREGGHTRRRILHHGDTTGKEIATRLLEACRRTPGITFYENHFAIDLITTARLGLATGDRCLGLYVLDEATSLIDPRTARHLEGSMAALLADRTVIAIAHRLHTAHDADRIAVVIEGRIAELGSHADLIAKNGEYARLWRTWRS